MRNAFLAMLLVVTALCVATPPAAAVTNQTATQSYCLAYNATAGTPLAQAVQDVEYSAGCVIQPGDIYTDGPLFPAIFTFTGSSLAFTIPAMTWIAHGNRTYTASQAETATASATNYYYLNCNQCSGIGNATWDTNTTGTLPHTWDVLMYTVVASGSGISSVTFPTPSIALFQQISLAGLLSLTTTTITGLVVPELSASEPLWFSNSESPFVTGLPPFYFAGMSSSGCSNSSDSILATFANSVGSAILQIACQNTGMLQGILVSGTITAESGILDSSISSTPGPLCAAQNVQYATCAPNEIPLADVSPSPVPTSTNNNVVIAQATKSPLPQPGTIYHTGPHISALAATSPLPSPCQTPTNGGVSCFNDSNAGGGATTYFGTAANNAKLDFNHTNSGDLTSSVPFAATELYATNELPANCAGFGTGGEILSGNDCISSLTNGATSFLSFASTGTQYTISTLYTPAPLAASAPVNITNSTSAITATVGAWAFQETNSGCGPAGGLATDILAQFANTLGNGLTLLCNGSASLVGAWTAANLKDTGLTSSTSGPLCGANNANITQCGVGIAAYCGSINPTNGQHFECGNLSNLSFTCSASSVCTIGTFTFTTAFANTTYICTASQFGSTTVYANRALIMGVSSKATSSVVINAAAISAVTGIGVNVNVICAE